MRLLSIAQGAEVARIQHGRVLERQEMVDAARGQQAAEVRHGGGGDGGGGSIVNHSIAASPSPNEGGRNTER